MIILRFLGWILIALALGFTIADISVQGITQQYGIVSAYKVFHTLIPGELIQTRIIISRVLHPILWDPFIRSLLSLPGWFILGLPGVFFVWKFQRTSTDVTDDVLISSYDDIVAAAKEFDAYIGDSTNSTPSKYGKMDNFDPTLDPPLIDVSGGEKNQSKSLELNSKKKT
jgi:hypothetical protein